MKYWVILNSCWAYLFQVATLIPPKTIFILKPFPCYQLTFYAHGSRDGFLKTCSDI